MIKLVMGSILLCILVVQGFLLDWKLRGDIAWHWLWVLAPAWGSIVLLLLAIVEGFILIVIADAALDTLDEYRGKHDL